MIGSTSVYPTEVNGSVQPNLESVCLQAAADEQGVSDPQRYNISGPLRPVTKKLRHDSKTHPHELFEEIDLIASSSNRKSILYSVMNRTLHVRRNVTCLFELIFHCHGFAPNKNHHGTSPCKIRPDKEAWVWYEVHQRSKVTKREEKHEDGD